MKFKRSLLFVFALLVCLLPSLAACSSSSQPKAAFSQKEFVISLNETINFFDYLKTENLQNFEFDFGGKELVSKNEDGSFTASARGRGVVQVKNGANVLASAKLIVKQKFDAPTSVRVDETGLMTWDTICLYDEGLVNASGYKVTINGQEDDAVAASYQLPQKGRYTVAVKALGTDYVDDSDYSQSMVVNYGIMEEVEITSFTTSSQYASETADITWSVATGARYNVYLNGILVRENVSQNTLSFDFAQFNSYQDIRLKIESIDSHNEMLPSSKTFTLRKVATPHMQYSFTNGNGKAYWEACDGASEYMLYCVDRLDMSNSTLVTVKENESYLPGLRQGIFFANIQARGGKGNDGVYYLNSAISQSEFAKLGTPNFTYEVIGKSLNIQFQEDAYIENYLLTADREYEFNTKQSLTASVDLSALTPGKYEFSLVSRPTLDNGGNVVALSNATYSSANVVNSDEAKVTVYVFEEFGAVNHTIVDNETILSFAEIENATDYSVTLNNNPCDIKAFNVEDGLVKLNLGDLSEIAPIAGGYQFKISALRADKTSVNVSAEKSVSILPLTAKATEQQNGYYAWQEVAGDARYEYEVYRVDKDFSVGDPVSSEALAQNGNIAQTRTQKQGFGYYMIRVYSKSEDLNTYLDSDYYDEKGYFEDCYIVTEQIETPELSLSYDRASDTCVLTISKVDYAGRYVVYVNGEREGAVTPTNQTLTEYNYTMKNKFTSGDYTITVIAEVYNGETGTLNNEDPELHPASEAATIKVSRLVAPTYSVDENEMLKVTLDEHADSLTIIRNSNEVSYTLTDGVAYLDLSDETEYYGDFELAMKFIAAAAEENNYYLDSFVETYKFRRTSQPNNIRYANGILSYDCQDASAVENYIITLTIITSYGDHVETIKTPNTSYNISAYIQNRLNTSEDFSDNYNQSTGITLEVSAHKLGLVGGVYYIPSRNGKTSTGGDKLTLEQLEAPTIVFDPSTMLLTWNAVGENTIYTVYIDDKAVAENVVNTQLRLNTIDFSAEKRVKVFASNAEYLTSSSSNEITIRQLSAPTSVKVTQNGILSFSIPTIDVAKLKAVNCNNSSDNVTIAAGGNTVTVNIADFVAAGQASLAFELIAADSDSRIENGKTITNYYVNSQVATYRFVDITDMNIAINEVKDGKLVWNELTSDFNGVTGNPVSYNLVVREGDRVVERITGLTENAYSLAELKTMLSKEKQLAVEIMIDDYEIKSNGGTGLGYYGKPSGTARLGEIDLISLITVEDMSIANEVDRMVAGKIQLSWADKWNLSNLTFNVSVNNANFTSLIPGAYGDNYNFVREETSDGGYVYKLLLNETLFAAGQNTILVTAFNGDTSSDTYAFMVRRYSQLLALSITDDGTLTIKPGYGDTVSGVEPSHFLIGLSVQGETQYIRYENADAVKEYNLLQHFNITNDGEFIELSGIYSIEVVAYDDEGKVLPSVQKQDLHGYRLNGVEVQSTDRGMVEITILNQTEIDENIAFIARRKQAGAFEGEGVAFTPERRGSTGVYEFSIIDFIDLFDIQDAGLVELEISVRKPGSLNAAWAYIKFEYASGDRAISLVRGRNYAEDYLRIGEIDGVRSTSFKLESQYLNEDNETVRLSQIYNADDVLGYWLVDSTQGIEYFTKSSPGRPGQDAGVIENNGVIEVYETDSNGEFVLNPDGSKRLLYTYTPCYAINLNEFFSTAAAGTYPIRVSRVAYSDDGGYHIQYNASTFSVTKLPTVTNVSLRDDRLTWAATTDGTVSGYYVYLNYRVGEELLSAGFQETHEAYLELQNLLVAGRNYEITVVTVSSVAGRLASVPTSAININKYQNPMQLEVQDGVIRFTLDSVRESDFVRAVRGASGNGIWNAVANNRFSSMYTFSAGTISTTYIELSFSSGNREYRTRVRAIDLIPDLSLITFESGSRTNVMDWILNSLAMPDENNANFRATRDVYNALVNASHGVSTDQILFDDFGSSVPNGAYNVSIRQIGIGAMGTVSSNFNAATSMYVAPAPTLTLSSSRVEDTGKNQYFVKFTPVSLYESLEAESALAERYVLNMKTPDGLIGYYFNIINDGGQYKIMDYSKSTYDSYGRRSLQNFTLSSSLNLDMEVEGGVVVGATINMTTLTTLAGMEKLQYNAAIYAGGNGYSVNSKANIISVTLLDINLSSLKVDDGVMSWNEPNRGGGYTTKARYYINNSIREQNIPFDNSGIATLNLNNGGRYNYLLLFVIGNYTSTTMTIDSPTYRINNLYKLYDPSVSGVGNIINISQSGIASGVSSDIFKVTNNVAKQSQDAKTLVYKNTFSNGNFAYMAGLQGLEPGNDGYSYKVTETTATEYYISNVGTSGSFAEPELPSESENNCDYVLSFVGTNSANLILSSNEISFNARMISSVSGGINIVDGDLVWAANASDQTAVPEGYSVVYRLTVDSYNEGSLVPTQSVFFTAKTTFNTINIPSMNGSEHYIFSIQKYVMRNGGTGANSIRTVEGDIYTRSAVEFAGEEKVYILASEPVNLGGHDASARIITKAPRISNIETRGGNLTWAVTGTGSAGVDTNNLRFQVADEEGNVIDGTVSEVGTTTSGEGADRVVTTTYRFTDRALSYRGGVPYKLRVYSYYSNSDSTANRIKSDPVNVEYRSGGNVESDVFKLPDITQNDFTISADANRTNRYRIDLSSFFASHPIRNSENYYKVEMTLKVWSASGATEYAHEVIPAGETVYKFFLLDIVSGLDSLIKVDETSPNVVSVAQGYGYSISFRAVDAQSTQSIILINGNQSDDIFITPVNFLGSDEISWNEQSRQLEWTYGGVPNDREGLYRVVVTYGLGNGQTTTEEVEVSDKFFKPTVLGWITNVKVYVRKDAASLYSAVPLDKDFNPNIDNRIFAGGSGTQASPYLIANEQQFYNIQYKNAQGVYYRQTTNLEIRDSDAGYWRGGFLGIYDGDGYTINFVSSQFSESNASVKPTGVGEMKFMQEASLFSEIASGARVSNLKLNVTLGSEDSVSLIEASTVYAALAISNNGTISNVSLESFQTNLSLRASVALGFSGLVVNNNNTIMDCENKVDFAFTTSPSYTGSIMYSAFAMTNGYSGAITRSVNNGNVDLSLRRSGTIAYLAGICLYNDRGTITQCGNNGNLTIGANSSTGYTGYAAGICLRTAGAATLRYCYNNGQISSVRADYVGGIAYNVTESNLIGVVTTASGVKFIADCSGEPSVQNSYCYAGDAYEGISTNDLTGEEIRIACGDGHSLVISKNEDESYTASIV